MRILRVCLKPYTYNGGGLDIIVTTDTRTPETHWRFEEREGCYRAQDGEFGRFYAWTGPGNQGGFGGSRHPVTMLDGSKRELLGPWSSRAGAVNAIFPDREPLVDCIDHQNCAIVCTKAALEQFGVRFIQAPDNFDIRFDPI